MLRRTPTTISLSSKDVQEHLDHMGSRLPRNRADVAKNAQIHDYEHVSEIHTQGSCRELTTNVFNRQKFTGLRSGSVVIASKQRLGTPESCEEHHELQRCPAGSPSPVVSDSLIECHADQQLNEVDENHLHDTLRDSVETPFDFGGFTDGFPDWSALEPGAASTPHGLPSRNGMLQSEIKISLPRSPLYSLHHPSSSSERFTSCLAPRLSVHSTPTVLFSQPARRTRQHRARTISHSFEESERAGAAYEYNRESSETEFESDLAQDEHRRSLHDELLGSSLRSSHSISMEYSEIPSLAPDPNRACIPKHAETSNEQSCSPRLPLPPPFSSVSHGVSGSTSLPMASFLGSPSISKLRHEAVRESSSWASLSVLSRRLEEEDDMNSVSTGSTVSSLRSLPYRLIAAYRHRSPIDTSVPPSVVAPSSTRVGRFHGYSSPATPAAPVPVGGTLASTPRRLRVYDDNLPASSQPQTPQHLPEFRHRSRHPVTAPVARGSRAFRQATSRFSRRLSTRSSSPPGLDRPGFEGLYGGQENEDEEVLFNRASRRLWELNSSRPARGEDEESSSGELDFNDDERYHV